MKRLPRLCSLVAVIRPPMAWQSSRQIDRPRPVPPNRRVVEESAWTNFSNTRSSCSAGMPMPVSATTNRTPASVRLTWTSTEPATVNFTALEIRLQRTWRTRVESPR